MGTVSSSPDEENSPFYSPLCCAKRRTYFEEPVTHLSWQRSSMRVSHQGKPGPPEGIVKVDEITHNSIVLSWFPPLDRGMGQILAYHIERFSYKDKKWQLVTGSCQGNTYKVRDLISGIKYLFRVRAENIIGVGRPSLESDAVVIPAFVDCKAKDSCTTFTRRGSNLLDGNSSVKTIVSRSLGSSDNLSRWSFPRQQSRRFSALHSVFKRPHSTGHRRASFTTGFRESRRLLKNNPLFKDEIESYKKTGFQQVAPDSDKKLDLGPSLKESAICAIEEHSINTEDESETVIIVSKGFVPALNLLTKQKSEPQLITKRPNIDCLRRSRNAISYQDLGSKEREAMFEFELDDDGSKVPMRKSSSQNRINVRKPLHSKLFMPPGEDSLDECGDIDEFRDNPPSDEDLIDNEIEDVVKSLTSLYHSQKSLCDNVSDEPEDNEKCVLPTEEKPSGVSLKTFDEPMTSEYDGSASESDEGKSTIPPVLSVFLETDESCDDDPTDTSVSSHHDGFTSDTDVDLADDEDMSESDLSLTDYFGDDSDDSADIESLNDTLIKTPSVELKIVDSSDEEVSLTPQKIDVQVHAARTPPTPRQNKFRHRKKSSSEVDLSVKDKQIHHQHNHLRSHLRSASVEADMTDSSSLEESKLSTDLLITDTNKNHCNLPEITVTGSEVITDLAVEEKYVETEKLTKDVDNDFTASGSRTPQGSDEGVVMETMSDSESVILIHSSEVIDKLQELLKKDPKLAEILTKHPQLKDAVMTSCISQKPSRSSAQKVTFADMKQNQL